MSDQERSHSKALSSLLDSEVKFTNNKKKTTKQFKRREAKINDFLDQAPVAQKVINPIHWLNHHPVNK